MQFSDLLCDIARPAPKKIWGLPAVINFFLGGMAAGYFILLGLSEAIDDRQSFGEPLGGLLAAAMVMAGLASLALEAGRPLRARHLAAHLKRSWMSREAATGLLFVAAAILDYLTGSFIARCLALAAGFSFLLSQGMMLRRCTAVPVWGDPLVPLLFISGGLTGGYALLLFNRCGLFLQQCDISPHVNTIALACLGLNFAAWAVLLLRRRPGDLQPVPRCLRQPAKVLIVMGIGQLLPIIFLTIARPWALNSSIQTATGLLIFTATVILIGNWAQKLWLIRCAQYLCGMRLER